MTSAVTPSDAEAAVREYLTFLADPASLIDPARVGQLEGEVASAKDPVDKLLAVAALHRAKAVDPDGYERAFVAHAKEWATAEGIPASAFEQLGVPRDVLKAAGIIVVGGRPRGRSVSARPTAARRPAIRSEALEAGILELAEPFSVKDVAEKVGGSAITVKAAIDRLEAQGKLVSAGERSGSRGRASRVWTVAVEPL